MSTERISVLHMPSIALGPGSSREAGHHLKLLGVEHALVVTDRFLLDSGLIDPVVQAVEADGVVTFTSDFLEITPPTKRSVPFDTVSAISPVFFSGS